MDSQSVEAIRKYRMSLMKAVESLLNPGTPKKSVEIACLSLDVTSFTDVSEERAISNLCGYPPCSFRLPEKKTWPKYAIRGKKVYDTSERRRFCTDKCYERFLHIVKQLPEEPLWFRGLKTDVKEETRLSFLEDEPERKGNGLPGREIDLTGRTDENDLSDAFNDLKLEDEEVEEPQTSVHLVNHVGSKAPQQQKDLDTDLTVQVAVSLSELLCEDTTEDDDEIQFRNYGDSEETGLGNWEPSKGKDKSKSTENRRGPPKMIDPLPMPPEKEKKPAPVRR